MSQEIPPPPGVSAIGKSGQRTQITKPTGVRVNSPASRVVRDSADPLQGKGRAVTGAVTPVGVEPSTSDVVELPLPKNLQNSKFSVTFESIDGNTYTFRTHDEKGKKFPYTDLMAMYIAIVELGKGGDLFEVLNAFRFSMTDASGRQYYPIPESIANRLREMGAYPRVQSDVADIAEEVADDKGFSLGE